jgi:hypothetical protein
MEKALTICVNMLYRYPFLTIGQNRSGQNQQLAKKWHNSIQMITWTS